MNEIVDEKVEVDEKTEVDERTRKKAKKAAQTPAGLDAAIAHVESPAPSYTVRSVSEIVSDRTPPPPEIWGGFQLETGNIMEIIGPSGIGKSRIVLNLAINQILGRDFAGLPPLKGHPLTWLFLGNENSKFRFRDDLLKMCGLPENEGIMNSEEFDEINKHLFLPTLESPDDFDVSLGTEGNKAKIVETMKRVNADVLVLDPWGSFIDGDELDDGDVVRTITTIRKMLAERKSAPTVAIIINHSRNGLKEIMNARGAECANYGKNSKKIFSLVRCVWNLRPGDRAFPSKKIELINAKRSNGVEYTPRAVDFNGNTHCYEHDTKFQPDAYQQELENAYKRHQTLQTAGTAENARKETEKANAEKLVAYLDAQSGPVYKKELEKWMKNTLKLGREARNDLYQGALINGTIARAREKIAQGKDIVWTTKKMTDLIAKAKPDSYILPPPPAATPGMVVEYDCLTGLAQ